MSKTIEVRTRAGTPGHAALLAAVQTDQRINPFDEIGQNWPDGLFTVAKWVEAFNREVVWTLKETAPEPAPKPFTATLMEPFPAGSVLQTTGGKWFRLTTAPVKLGPDRYAATAEYCDPPAQQEPPPAPESDPVLAELVKIRRLLEKLCAK